MGTTSRAGAASHGSGAEQLPQPIPASTLGASQATVGSHHFMRALTPGIHLAIKRLVVGITVLASLGLLHGSQEMSLLDSILARGELRMATRPGPLTWYEDGRGANGFEYLLVREFADRLGVELKVTTTATLGGIFNMLGGPNADLGAAVLTVTPDRERRIRFSDPYAETVQMVLHRRGTRAPASVEDLVGRELVVIADSSHEERLVELREAYPALAWRRLADAEMLDLMEMVHRGEVEFAIIDSTTYNANRNLYFNARAAFEISDPQPLAWAFAYHGDSSLIRAVNAFLEDIRGSGLLDELKLRFFTGIEDFSLSSSHVFFQMVESRLPQFEESFRRVAEETGIDWHLLAAMAYQESHWNPEAVSPTGVKGLMMLTRRAASEVGVTDRTDAEQSLWGGAHYYLQVKDRIPARITEPDRTWFALAAYNVGLGHLEDARVLTQRAGKNPDLWQDVREHLPLLQRRQYYSTVRHGYARGNEPVTFVANIRKYMRILQWRSNEEERREMRVPEPIETTPEKWDLRSFMTL